MSIRRCVAELLVLFPVYRTYGSAEGMPALDRELLARTARTAGRPCTRPITRPCMWWKAGWAATCCSTPAMPAAAHCSCAPSPASSN
jgi:hypothetical protein